VESEGVSKRLDDASTSKLVENFVAQYRKPFSIDILCEMIGKTRKQVRPVVTRLMFNDRIMEIEAGIFVAVRQERLNLSRMNGNMLWSYNASVGERVLEILESQSISNVRGLAKVMGVSRQYAYLYLEALASIGLVGYEDGCYVRVKRQDDTPIIKLGSMIDKGILGRLRWPEGDGRRNRGRSKSK
jgi:DNA-binding FadR family transcriptional regulator